MEKTVTLYCELGEHEWERLSQRGRRPVNCPLHQPVTDEISDDERQDRIRKRVEKARETREANSQEKQRDSISKVNLYRKWCADHDKLWHIREAQGLDSEQAIVCAMEYHEKWDEIGVPQMPESVDYIITNRKEELNAV